MRHIGKSIGVVCLLVTACGDENRVLLSEPEGLQAARIEYYGEPARISVPESAAVGEAFVISIETYGSSCIGPGPTPVKLLGGRLEIRPLDDFPEPGTVCPSDLRLNDHSVTYSVDAATTLEIAVHGVRVSEAGVEDVIVTRSVVVEGGGG